MKDFVEKSGISSTMYKPFWACYSVISHCLMYLVCEIYSQTFYKQEMEREIIMLEDGGTAGIDWLCDKGTKSGIPTEADKNKPILIMAPGLGGSVKNLYTTALGFAAQQAGYKVGTILFRGADGLPVTSGKLSYSGCWQDCKTVLEYAYDRYVIDSETKEKKTRFYVYGCSLGAQILALYMLKDADRAYEMIDGSAIYGNPWSAAKGEKYAHSHQFGIYIKVLGVKLTEDIRKQQLPLLKPYLPEEEYDQYETALRTSWLGMLTLDSKVYPRMFGFKDKQDYCESVTVVEHCLNIKVPTFALGSADDQICDPSLAPTDIAWRKGSNICLATTNHGGHVCHIAGSLLPKSWYSEPVMTFFQYLETR